MMLDPVIWTSEMESRLALLQPAASFGSSEWPTNIGVALSALTSHDVDTKNPRLREAAVLDHAGRRRG